MAARPATTSAADFLPVSRSLAALELAAKACRGCDLYHNATQTVFGSGPEGALLMLVGEQPGDREDIEGEPFVGPAGRLLFQALASLGVSRERTYATNAVKHFKWTPKGKRRIHQTPRASEVRACYPWLEAEIEAVRPRLIACLGSTAVAALLGREVKVMRDRGRILEATHGPCLVTVHPSSLLRVEDEGQRAAAYEAFLADLREGLRFIESSA